VNSTEPGLPHQKPPASKTLPARVTAGILLGGGLWMAILVLAGAPPFDLALAQTAGAAKTITGAAGTYWLPPNASAHGGDVDFLFNVINVVVGISFIGVEILLVVFALRYRHRPGRKATYIHGNHKLEMAWTIVPAIILAVLVFLSRSTWAKIRYGDGPDPATSTNIEVTGQQFAWTFRMLGTAEKFNKAADISPQGQVHVPVNKPVTVKLHSRDVLHSFFLPNMRVKLDAVPGMTGRLWFTPVVPGTYEVVCAELCGAEHWKMRAVLTVESEADYEAWLKKEAEFVPDKPK